MPYIMYHSSYHSKANTTHSTIVDIQYYFVLNSDEYHMLQFLHPAEIKLDHIVQLQIYDELQINRSASHSIPK